MAIATFEEFTLELVYHQSSLTGIQIVTTDDSLFSHLQYLFERTRKLLVDIRLRLAQLKKERSMYVTFPSPFVSYAVGGGNAPTFANAVAESSFYAGSRHNVRRKPNTPHAWLLDPFGPLPTSSCFAFVFSVMLYLLFARAFYIFRP